MGLLEPAGSGVRRHHFVVSGSLRLAMGLGLLTVVARLLFTLSMGIKTMVLGEYIGKTYYEAKQRPVYLIRMLQGQSMSSPQADAPAPLRDEKAWCAAYH